MFQPSSLSWMRNGCCLKWLGVALLCAVVLFQPAAHGQEPQTLEVGKAIERELAGGQSHVYQIALAVGQYFYVVVEQHGIDVVVTLFGPNNEKIAEFDREVRIQGQEAVMHIAKVSGTHRLEVKPKQQSSAIGRYQVHILELRVPTEKEQSLQEALDLAAEFAKLYDASKYDEARPLLERALEIRERAVGSDHPDVAQSLYQLGKLYRVKGEYAQAEPLQRRALAIREKLLGLDHPDTAASLNELGRLRRLKGDYAQAESLYLRALAIQEKQLGSDHMDVAEIVNNLAVLYRSRGDLAKAEAFYQRALVIAEKQLGPEDISTASIINNLAVLYRVRGNYAQAEPFFLRALNIREKKLSLDHPDVALTLDQLAGLYKNMGADKKAEPLYQRALAIREKKLGPEHPDTASSLNNLAGLYSARDDFAQAETLYQRALAVYEKKLGSDHPDFAQTLNNLATLYVGKGDFTQAESFLQRSYAIKEKKLGPEHSESLLSLNNLARLCTLKGDFAQAEQLFSRILAAREKTLGSENRYVATTLTDLAELYQEKGDYLLAEPLYQRALMIQEKALGPEHTEVGLTLYALSKLYLNQEKYVQAESLVERALQIQEKKLGPEHSEIANLLSSLAGLAHGKGDFAKAESFWQRALVIQEKAQGLEHPFAARAFKGLGAAYFAQGNYAKAEPVFLRSLTIREKMLGIHPEVADSLDLLAGFYLAWGNTSRALEFQQRATEARESSLNRILVAGSERQKVVYLNRFTSEFNRILSMHAHTMPDNAEALALAVTTLLRRKARGLDAMTDTLSILRNRATPQDRLLLDKLIDVRSQLATLTLRGPGSIKPEGYRAQVKNLEETAEKIETELSAHSAEFREPSGPITLATVQTSIPTEAALIEFATYAPLDVNARSRGPLRYVAYLLTSQGKPRWVELGEAAPIDRAIDAWRQALRDPQRADAKTLAGAVDAKVMQPVRALLGEVKHLLISPDGALNLIPFAALVDKQGHYLVERYSISYLTSGRDLLRLQVPRPSKDEMLVMADPDFGGAAQQAINTHRSSATRPQTRGPIRNFAEAYFEPLPETGREAQAIRGLLPEARVRVKEQATEAALKQIHAPKILHIATHGFFLQDEDASVAKTRGLSFLDGTAELRGSNWATKIENPLLRSGLALAGFNQHKSGDDDGALTALEAAGLDLWGTKLVVLSACDTGVGEIKNGEGVYGLRRALVLAGAETQVMSLWKVSDYVTRLWMTDYYTGLQQGLGRGEALRQVQLKMLRSKERRHPFYWASFIQSGEWANLAGKR